MIVSYVATPTECHYIIQDMKDDDDDEPELDNDIFADVMWNDAVVIWQRFECKEITVTCIAALIS